MDRRQQTGSAFVVSLFLLAVLALLGVGVVATATSDLKVSDNYQRSMSCLYAADAGANHAVAMMQSDPATGDIPPDPNGTPLETGSIGPNTYAIWLWNQRLAGNGSTIDFTSEESRQFVVEGKDDKGAIRKLQGIIRPHRDTPKALDRAVFTCQAADLGGGGAFTGDIYATGNVDYGGTSIRRVNVETRGELSVNKKITGDVHVNGAIHNNTQTVNGWCKTAQSSVDNASNCQGGVQTNVSPAPTKDYCNNASSDWDAEMLDFTSDDVADFEASTPSGNKRATGWSTGSDIALGDAQYYVTGGNVVWTGNDITYTGNSSLVVDGGYDFTCSGCTIQKAGGAPASSTFTLITSSGNILLTSSSNNSMKFTGVLWGGVTSAAGALPAKGSVTVSGKCSVKVDGEVVAVGGGVTVSGGNAKLEVQVADDKPPVFGPLDGFLISEWLEVR